MAGPTIPRPAPTQRATRGIAGPTVAPTVAPITRLGGRRRRRILPTVKGRPWRRAGHWHRGILCGFPNAPSRTVSAAVTADRNAAPLPPPPPACGASGGAPADLVWRRQARALVEDLFARSPAIYWTDLLLSAGFAWLATAVYLSAPAWSAAQLLGFVVAGVLFFRAGTFIHEIVHMPASQMRWFKRVWNLVIGIPLLMPWIFYRSHADHHSARHFGTPADGEYLPLGAAPLRETLKYLAQAPLLPLLMVVRFGIVGPLSWFVPPLREWVLTAASAAVSNPYYRKRFPKRDERHLLAVEALCFVYLLALALVSWQGLIDPLRLAQGYLLLAFALSLNWVRNLAAHHYVNAGERMTLAAQIADSINITGQTWLTILMFPVGLRYHALHHLFPALPYHRMGEAHRRLMQGLPPEAGYRATNCESFFGAVAGLWRSASRTAPRRSAMRAWLAAAGRRS